MSVENEGRSAEQAQLKAIATRHQELGRAIVGVTDA